MLCPHTQICDTVCPHYYNVHCYNADSDRINNGQKRRSHESRGEQSGKVPDGEV